MLRGVYEFFFDRFEITLVIGKLYIIYVNTFVSEMNSMEWVYIYICSRNRKGIFIQRNTRVHI